MSKTISAVFKWLTIISEALSQKPVHKWNDFEVLPQGWNIVLLQDFLLLSICSYLTVNWTLRECWENIRQVGTIKISEELIPYACIERHSFIFLYKYRTCINLICSLSKESSRIWSQHETMFTNHFIL